MSSIEERVQRGIDLLDCQGPKDWRRMVDVNSLRMGSYCDCVLGQVFSDENDKCPYEKGKHVLGIEMYQSDVYGFDITGNGEDEFLDLQAEWVRRLTEETTT